LAVFRRHPAAVPFLRLTVDVTLQAPCPICTRSFASNRIDKHIAICERTSTKTRKTFNSTKARLEGTEAVQFVEDKLLKPKTIPSVSQRVASKENEVEKDDEALTATTCRPRLVPKKPPADSRADASAGNGKVPQWKAEHEEFVANIRAARQYDAAGAQPCPCSMLCH
jgi:hypothetical protein